MRLFVAIDLPESVKYYLRERQLKIPPEARLTKAHDFHMTLKFLGECSEEKMENSINALKMISFRPFEAQLGKIGAFGMLPKVVWVSVAAPPVLTELVEAIEEALQSVGFPRGKKFVPHVTLARVKQCDNSRKFLEDLKKMTAARLQFRVEHFYLYESKLSPAGATYLKRAPF